MTLHCFGTSIVCDADSVELDVVDSLGYARTVHVTMSDVLYNHFKDVGEVYDILSSRPVPFDVREARFFCGSDLIFRIHA